MPVINSVAEGAEEVAAWRRDLHQHPEIEYEVHRTAGIVADKLRAFGCDEVVTGIGRTGVVGVIRGRAPGERTIAMRADMDALPMTEANTALPHVSTVPGKMHACGHDGHTAMLLGAARHLCATRNFAGTAIVVFQPAEEGKAGAKAMLDDGLMTRFPIDEIYGMHNVPGIPIGHFAIRPGPIMAAADRFEIMIEGRGGHGAAPHMSVDPVLAGAQITNALQMIASRNADPLDSAVVSVTQFHAGTVDNVIPQTARLSGTFRSLREETRTMIETRLREIVRGISDAHGTKATVNVARGYPVTVNHVDQAHFAAGIAAEVAGATQVGGTDPMMGAEDFSYMLLARPGAFMFIGNGDSAGLHNPGYDFDDAALPFGISYWARLIETAMPV